MAYFDSEKNKALWNTRMAALRQERDRRERDGYKPQNRRNPAVESLNTEATREPGVRIITFDELVRKVEGQRRQERIYERAIAIEKRMQRERQMQSGAVAAAR